MRIMQLAPITLVLASPLAHAVYPTGTGTTFVTNFSSAYYGNAGTMTFHDWNYVGPNGAGANDYYVPGTSGFDASRIGQIQNVVTLDPDRLTPDPAKTVRGDDNTLYSNANMDGQVNFYRWAYTTIGGSTFNNMQIDKAGNYFVARNDMHFQYYDTFSYHDSTGVNPDDLYNTSINFQPYAVSDARGWCGSTMISNPNGVATMAGQVSFDFAFDAYLVNQNPVPGQGGGTQVVPDFVMRSYGDYQINMGTTQLTYTGNAVMNNTNPVTGQLDPAYQNRVSFLGGGVVPKGTWVTADSYDGTGTANTDRVLNPDSTWHLTVAGDGIAALCDPNVDSVRADGAVCWRNSFAGYAFLMRADGSRTLTWISPDGHSDYVATDPAAYTSLAAVPVPAAAWLFGSGMVALVGMARRKKVQAEFIST